jgi:tetratricopeptide (TPR) repeat protein
LRIRPQFRLALLCSFLFCPAPGFPQDNPSQNLDRQFQSAVAQYRAGHFAEATTQLEALLPQAPRSFELHELLGLVYAAQSQDARALSHFEMAVRLEPDSAAARTNLAASLVRSGKSGLAEVQLKKALELNPRDYEANHDLADFYVQGGKIADAIPFLEKAQKINPSSYDNGYDLAQTYFLTGRLDEARQLVENLLSLKNTAELHDLLAQIDEKDKKFVEAANEFETAVHMDPSEDNLFDWGSELLLHFTYDPAIDVFEQATQRYPNSPRLLIGLGMALYSQGRYDEAITALITAADITPSDPSCYLFLSGAYERSPKHADDVIQRFRRYAELQPRNALAQYYYAMSLWKGKPTVDSGLDLPMIESLLQKSIALDSSLPEVHLQLGNLYADRSDYAKAIPEYERALQLNPDLTTAHYYLGLYYARSGQKDRAKQEMATYRQLRAQRSAEGDKQAAEIQQFVYTAKAAPGPKP